MPSVLDFDFILEPLFMRRLLRVLERSVPIVPSLFIVPELGVWFIVPLFVVPLFIVPELGV